MQNVARGLAVAAVVFAAIGGSQAQLLAKVKNFVNNIPTFNSNNDPSFAVQDGSVPAQQKNQCSCWEISGIMWESVL